MTSTTARDRVLVVEGDPTARLGLTGLVRAWGFVTEAAADVKKRSSVSPPSGRPS